MGLNQYLKYFVLVSITLIFDSCFPNPGEPEKDAYLYTGTINISMFVQDSVIPKKCYDVRNERNWFRYSSTIDAYIIYATDTLYQNTCGYISDQGRGYTVTLLDTVTATESLHHTFGKFKFTWKNPDVDETWVKSLKIVDFNEAIPTPLWRNHEAELPYDFTYFGNAGHLQSTYGIINHGYELEFKKVSL